MKFHMYHSPLLHTVFYDGNINWALTSNHLDRIIRFEPLMCRFIILGKESDLDQSETNLSQLIAFSFTGVQMFPSLLL